MAYYESTKINNIFSFDQKMLMRRHEDRHRRLDSSRSSSFAVLFHRLPQNHQSYFLVWVVLLCCNCCCPLVQASWHALLRDNTEPNHLWVDYRGNKAAEHEDARRRRDQFADDVPVSTINYQPYGESYETLRIHFVTDLLEQRLGVATEAENGGNNKNSDLDDKIREIIDTILPQAAATWTRHLSVVPVRDSIRVTSDDCFGFLQDELDGDGIAVDNADLVIVVTARDSVVVDGVETAVCAGEGEEGGTLALAAPCTLDQYDRPVIGLFNFCLGYYDNPETPLYSLVRNLYAQDSLTPGPFNGSGTSSTSDHVLSNRLELDIAEHELGHALGFVNWMLKYFRADGQPRTPRPFQAKTHPCPNGDGSIYAAFPDSNTVRLIDTYDGGRSASYTLVTPAVQQVVRNHFNCSTLAGARLDDAYTDVDGICLGSHWHERTAFGELMGPGLSPGHENFLSALTLAALDDSGWYKVKYGENVETPSYGLAQGCAFVEKPCIQNGVAGTAATGAAENHFCTSPIRFDGDRLSTETLQHISCDPGHRHWTACNLWDVNSFPFEISNAAVLEQSIRYFPDDTNLVGLLDKAGYCPIADIPLGVDCSSTELGHSYVSFYDGEVVGASSRCVDATTTTTTATAETKIYRPACLKVSCDAVRRKIVVHIGETDITCESDGQQIQFPSISATTASEQVFICPRLAAICPQLVACPADCSGRGICRLGDAEQAPSCDCFSGENNDCQADFGKPSPPRSASKNRLGSSNFTFIIVAVGFVPAANALLLWIDSLF